MVLFSVKIDLMKEIKVHSTQEGTVLDFIGDMDQSFEFPRPETITGKVVIMDFSQLKLINSLGVRNFIVFIKALSAEKIIYRACSCLMVNQFNMVKNMVTERVIVESFYAPYYAPLSHEEMELLIYSNEVQSGLAPKRLHPKTGEELEFDDLDERYFFFLKSST